MKILGIISALMTLIIWILVAGLWVRSYWREDRVSLGWSWQRPVEPEFARFSGRFGSTCFVGVSGKGGAGIIVLRRSQFIWPRKTLTGVTWTTGSTPTYPTETGAKAIMQLIENTGRLFVVQLPAVNKIGGGRLVLSRAPLAPPPSAPRFQFTQWGDPMHPHLHTGDPTILLIVPYWALLLFATAGVLLTIPYVLRPLRQWRCVAAGCCPVCGYDLRATPNQCPECGTAVEAREPVPERN